MSSDIDAVTGETADPARVAAVHETGLLDTGPEEAFDRVARLASSLTGAPMVVVSLVDEHRSFWKSAVGTPASRSVPVGESFCRHVVAAGAGVVVDDVAGAPELDGIPAVSTLGVAAWAAYPILGPDHVVLGSLCAMDVATRQWSAADREGLETLAQAAAGEMALRVALRDARTASAEAEHHARQADLHAQEAAELAHTLQESLLPADVPQVPGLEVATRYRPGGRGAEVLGDFYDVFPVPGGWGVAIGDVCGKGVRAARATALARSTLRAVGHLEPDPTEVLGTLHEVLHVWFGEQYSFVTATYATLTDGPDDDLDAVVVNAGHPPAFLVRADGEVRQFSDGGHVLGLRHEAVVGTELAELRRGDTLVLYTDGVTESRAGRGRPQFGEDGLARLLESLPPGATAEEVAEAVSRAALDHAEGAVPDDTAIVVVRRR